MESRNRARTTGISDRSAIIRCFCSTARETAWRRNCDRAMCPVRRAGKEGVIRYDAAFAKPEIYEALEERGVKYAIRIPANENLERDINELLTRPVGRPSHKPVVWYRGF